MISIMSDHPVACAVPPQTPHPMWSEEWPLVLLLTAILAIQQLRFLFMKRVQAKQSDGVETTNTTTIHGNDNININTGNNSTVVVTTRSTNTSEECCNVKTQPTPQHTCQEEENMISIFSVLPKPVGKFPRLNTKTQVTCRRYMDNLAQLSAEGKIYKCEKTIERLRKVKMDPDYQVSLRHAATLNAINEGKFEKASRLLGEAEILLTDTRNEDEHRLRWYHQKSLLKLQQGKHAAGIQLTEEALSLVSIMAPGCISAWLLINHAWFLTKIAADEDNTNDRRALVKKAKTFYQQAIDHAESEYPMQMSYFQSRVPQYAKIGLAFLYLGCWQSVDSSRIGVSTDLPRDDIIKAKDIIEEVQNEGPVCNKSKVLLLLAKVCLQFRLGSYQEAYDLAEEAKKLAAKHYFWNLEKFADSIGKTLPMH
ncbi:uncharacterized protein LOC144871335 [Branchiostoma floridae x Branchiostoma japonicum]